MEVKKKENREVIAKMSESEYEFIRWLLSNLDGSLGLEYDRSERLYYIKMNIALGLDNHILLNRILRDMEKCMP